MSFSAVSQAPFEPLRLSSFRVLPRKTHFLLPWLWRRGSELQALSFWIAWQGRILFLYYLPEFIGQDWHGNTHYALGIPCQEPLCPGGCGGCRAPSLPRPCHQLLFISDFLGDPTAALFLLVRPPSRPISKAALSFFLRDVIKSAHASIPASSCSELKIHAHDVNEVAVCILMRTNSSIPSILRAARWRTPSVFIKHYLWEIVWREDFAAPLTPVAVGGYVGA